MEVEQPRITKELSHGLSIFTHQLDVSAISASKKPTIISENKTKLSILESVLKEILFNSELADKHELKMWLINTISSLNVEQKTKTTKIMNIVEKPGNLEFKRQLLLFVCQKMPSRVAKVFMNRTYLLQQYFAQADDRIIRWFSFRFSGKNELGALALEQYLFLHRDSLWEKLHWTGKRPVPPCVAIQKKNLLMELDLLRTIKFLATERPEDRASFWESDYFKECLHDGTFLELDYSYFADVMLQMLNSTSSRTDKEDIIHLIEKYIASESFKDLTQKILMLLDDNDLLHFMYRLSASSRAASKEDMISAMIVCECKWNSLEDAVFYNILANHRRQLLKFFIDETSTQRLEFEEWMKSHNVNIGSTSSEEETAHYVCREYYATQPLLEQCRFALLEAFLVLYRITCMCSDDTNALEQIMKNAKIPYERVTLDTHTKKRKRHHHRHHKRRRGDYSDDEDDEDTESKQLIGWRFSDGSSSESSNITYSPSDTPLYLSQRFLLNIINSLVKQ